MQHMHAAAALFLLPFFKINYFSHTKLDIIQKCKHSKLIL